MTEKTSEKTAEKTTSIYSSIFPLSASTKTAVGSFVSGTPNPLYALCPSLCLFLCLSFCLPLYQFYPSLYPSVRTFYFSTSYGIAK